jgi:hypothetical protein
MQPELALARRTDPKSSHAAASHVGEFLTGHRALILASIVLHPGRTAAELEKFCPLNSHQIGKRLGGPGGMEAAGLVYRVAREKKPAIWFSGKGGE